jgi:hypothetical protein
LPSEGSPRAINPTCESRWHPSSSAALVDALCLHRRSVYGMMYPHFPTAEQGRPLQQSAWVAHIWP